MEAPMRTTLATLFLLFAAALVAQEMWVKPYPLFTPWDTVEPSGILASQDGGYLVYGNVFNYDWLASCGFIMKFDHTGEYQWMAVDSVVSDWAMIDAMVMTDDGGFFSYNDDSGLTRWDSSGQVQWHISRHQGGYLGYATSMDSTADNQLILTGSDNDIPSIQKIAYDGSVIWTRGYHFSDLDYANFSTIRTLPDGGFLAGGGGAFKNASSHYD
jgi:hypothetical protein